MIPTLILALSVGAPALKERGKPASMVGTWEVESITSNGKSSTTTAGLTYTFTEDGKWLIHRNGKETSPSLNRGYTADPKADPPSMDLFTGTGKGRGRLLGIYKVEKDRLTICGTRATGAKRPNKFEAPTGSGKILYVLKRARKD